MLRGVTGFKSLPAAFTKPRAGDPTTPSHVERRHEARLAAWPRAGAESEQTEIPRRSALARQPGLSGQAAGMSDRGSGEVTTVPRGGGSTEGGEGGRQEEGGHSRREGSKGGRGLKHTQETVAVMG